jgi:hypothetical protein
MLRFLRAALSVAALAFLGMPAVADRGVGVSLGSISVDDRLARGGSYHLATLGVINTGDEPGEYEVRVTHLDSQPQLRPGAGWFDLQPRRFFLAAGEAQSVEVHLNLPMGADPGDYFAYLEAHPLTNDQGVSIGVAAATKLTFSVKPSSWLDALVVRTNRLLDDVYPWAYLLGAAVLVALAIRHLRRSFRIDVKVQRR